MSSALDADIEPPVLPDGFDYYGFQKGAIAFAVAAKRALPALPMGAGKTLVALSALQHEDLFPALVVCPAVMKLVSPCHRGSTCTCTWLGTPAPAAEPRFIPTFTPCGE